jgi:hypothetical protein
MAEGWSAASGVPTASDGQLEAITLTLCCTALYCIALQILLSIRLWLRLVGSRQRAYRITS